jgi:FMN reductase
VLTSLRSIVHALRGWPTPFGAGINTLETRFDSVDTCSDAKVVDQLATVGQQAAQFALAFTAHRAPGPSASGVPVQQAQSARLLHAV